MFRTQRDCSSVGWPLDGLRALSPDISEHAERGRMRAVAIGGGRAVEVDTPLAHAHADWHGADSTGMTLNASKFGVLQWIVLGKEECPPERVMVRLPCFTSH